MKFSQRVGIVPAEKVIQKNSIDQELRNGLWNILMLFYWNNYEAPYNYGLSRSDFVKNSNLEELVERLWIHYFKRPVDTIERYWEYCLKDIRNYFFNAKWHEVYDLIEFIAINGSQNPNKEFIDTCNVILERENAAYRFVDHNMVEITSDEEIESIEEAIESATPFPGVKSHLHTALNLLSDRTNPNYRNSIKESISAVEALAKHLANDSNATLGSILKTLEKEQNLHPALKNAFSSLYGYTSDAKGIRHALLDEDNLEQVDARFMLVCCSAFVNYVVAKTV